MLIGLLAGNRLVLGRVELLAHRRDGRQTLGLEDVIELPDHQLDAVEPVAVGALGCVLERALEIISERQQLAEQLLVRELAAIGQVLAGAPLVVLEVGGEPLVTGKGRLRLVARRLQFRIDRLLGLGRLTLYRRAGPGVRHARAAWFATRGIGGLVLR